MQSKHKRWGNIRGVSAFAVCGGEDAGIQLAKLKSGVQVCVATPGRLIDFIYSRSIDLSQVETFILDEADEMLSMGFFDDLEFIFRCLIHEHQTLLFSATMPATIQRIASDFMKDPHEIKLNLSDVAPSKLEHRFLYCQAKERQEKLLGLLKDLEVQQCIVFCQSRREVEAVCQRLSKEMGQVDFLHAGLGQGIRTIVTNKFRSKKIKILVATDVVSRGLDFSGVSHVVIYSISSDPETHVHRSGRTGRQDREGMAITLVTPHDRNKIKTCFVLDEFRSTVDWGTATE